MALNISFPQFADQPILETLPQDNVQAGQTNTTNQPLPKNKQIPMMFLRLLWQMG